MHPPSASRRLSAALNARSCVRRFVRPDQSRSVPPRLTAHPSAPSRTRAGRLLRRPPQHSDARLRQWTVVLCPPQTAAPHGKGRECWRKDDSSVSCSTPPGMVRATTRSQGCGTAHPVLRSHHAATGDRDELRRSNLTRNGRASTESQTHFRGRVLHYG